MKTKERHHLKENALAHSLTSAREFVESRKQQVGGAIGIAVLVVAVVAGVLIFRNRADTRGEEQLAEALVALNARVVPANAATAPGELPAAAQIGATGSFQTEEAKLAVALPKLKTAADAFPDTSAGIQARYHYAAVLAALGRHADAVKEFDDVTRRAGADTLYGRMASLGKADTQSKAGEIDGAIASWKALADKKDPNLPEDAILMELGKAYQTKGSREDARKTFTQLVEQFPMSPYAAEARAELDTLKG